MIERLQEQQPQLFKGLKMGKKKKRKSKAAKKQAAVAASAQQQQHDAGGMQEHSNGSGNGSSGNGTGRPDQAATAHATEVHVSSSAEPDDAAPTSSRQHATVAT